MAIIKVAAEQRTLSEPAAVTAFLSRYGVDYERWSTDRQLVADSTADEVLGETATEVEALEGRGGYHAADGFDATPDPPNLDARLARFSGEHWHDEDEVRFIVEGRGLYHVPPPQEPVFAIEVEAGDLIRVPR